MFTGLLKLSTSVSAIQNRKWKGSLCSVAVLIAVANPPFDKPSYIFTDSKAYLVFHVVKHKDWKIKGYSSLGVQMMEWHSSYLLNCLCHSKRCPWSGPILWQDRLESDCWLRLTTQIITISACIHEHSGHDDTSTITVWTQSKGLCISYAKPTPDCRICDSSSKLTVLWWGRSYCTEHWPLRPLLEYWQHSFDFISGHEWCLTTADTFLGYRITVPVYSGNTILSFEINLITIHRLSLHQPQS